MARESSVDGLQFDERVLIGGDPAGHGPPICRGLGMDRTLPSTVLGRRHPGDQLGAIVAQHVGVARGLIGEHGRHLTWDTFDGYIRR